MGLFNKKKKEEKMLPLPEFPKLSEPNFPFYDEQVDSKESFQKPQEFRKVMASEDFSFEKTVPNMEKEEMNFEDFVPRRSPITTIERHDDKPLFVKVDKYKESMKTVEAVKAKLRDDEEKELQEWQSSLNEIREKLMKVDKDLFEV